MMTDMRICKQTNSADNWQQTFAAALLDSNQRTPDGLKAWNGSDPSVRFNVYRNNVVVNLVEGLVGTFPVCCELVGNEFFRAMADVFVRSSPPTSPILSLYGAALPDFIEHFEPAKGLPYLADMARLEHARAAAYHAADADTLGQGDWSVVNAADAGAVKLDLHPSAHIMESRFAIFSLWAAHQGALDFADVDIAMAEEFLIIRPQLDVEVMQLLTGGAHFLRGLQNAMPIGEAASQAKALVSTFDLAANIAVVISSGIATRINI